MVKKWYEQDNVEVVCYKYDTEEEMEEHIFDMSADGWCLGERHEELMEDFFGSVEYYKQKECNTLKNE